MARVRPDRAYQLLERCPRCMSMYLEALPQLRARCLCCDLVYRRVWRKG